jgi:Uncharacterized NAD(FAD)-dependent dehydrogenases
MDNMRVVILGGNPAGMSAASRIKRKSPDTEVIVLEKTDEVSYGACGLPYYVAGLNEDLDLIRIRKAPEFESAGIRVRTGCEATGIDYEEKYVRAVSEEEGEITEAYDKLIIATGASPKLLNVEGMELMNIYSLKTLKDAEELKRGLLGGQKNVVIIGGGYIGLELAEACLLKKVKSVRIIEAADRILSVFDAEFGEGAVRELERHGVSVHTKECVRSFEGEDGRVKGVTTDKGSYEADLVIMSVGISPNTAFAGDIEKLPNGAIVTDKAMRTAKKDVYAAGDCAAVWHRLLDKPSYIALGTNANKQGRLAGDSVLGRPVCFDRALGTAMLRCMDLELAKTGLSEEEARRAGITYKTKLVEARSHARYYPAPCPVTIKLVYHAKSRRILGAQIMGEREAAWRIDIFACAIDREMTTEELGYLDLGYAPMFAGVWDAVQIAANAAK